MKRRKSPKTFDSAIGEDPDTVHDIKQCGEQYTFLEHSANQIMRKDKRHNVAYVFIELD